MPMIAGVNSEEGLLTSAGIHKDFVAKKNKK